MGFARIWRISLLVWLISSPLFNTRTHSASSIQYEWQSTLPVARREHSMAGSETTIFLFGGYKTEGTQRHLNDLWGLTNGKWSLIAQNGPSPRRRSALVYDVARQELVLFGGWNGSSELGDTWVWTGGTWIQRTPSQSPSARQRHAMVYDPSRQQIVLFGGSNGSDLNDTWLWNGTTWTQALPAQSPPARQRHALGYDALHQHVVLFGGMNGTTRLGDTWLWNGTQWTQATPAQSPSARSDHVLVGTSQQLLLFSGDDATNYRNDLWNWDGTTWNQQSVSLSPQLRASSAGATLVNSPALIIFGGAGLSTFLADTWLWNGTQWSSVAPPIQPQPRSQHALGYDSSNFVSILFGGVNNGIPLGDTWAWDGTQWILTQPNSSPTPRFGHAMVFDPLRQKILLFGGYNSTSRNDTWEWDGSTWVQRQPIQSPPARWGHALVFDQSRGHVLLFGGSSGTSGYYNDTWEWDGTTWTQLNIATAPPPRRGHALTYDSLRQRIVLFGGYHLNNGVTTYYNDTWEWNGSTWLQRTSLLNPTGRANHSLTYDVVQQRAVLLGGISTTGIDDTIWEWDGIQWQTNQAQPVPLTRSAHASTYDLRRCQIIVFGGLGLNGLLQDQWQRQANQCLTPPIAHIDSVAPNPANRSRDLVTFIGSGTSTQAGQRITDYRWLRDDAVLLGNTATFTFNPQTLSLGDHSISFAVRDSAGYWSEPVTTTLRVIDDPLLFTATNDISLTLVSGSQTERLFTIENRGGSPLDVTLRLTNTQQLKPVEPTVMLPPLTLPRPTFTNERLDPNLKTFLNTPTNEQATFLVYLNTIADLRPAYSISDWNARGEYVVNQLQTVAQQSQSEIVTYLNQQQSQGDVKSYQSLYSLNALIIHGNAQTLQHLLFEPEVIAINANETMALPEMTSETPATVQTGVPQWNISRIRADQVWNELGVSGEGVVVGSIDTGVMLMHPLLQANYRGKQSDGSYDHTYSWFDPTKTFPNQPNDNNGHGTHTTGTMVGLDGIGVAPKAKWIAAKGCTNTTCNDGDLLKAMEWMLAPYPANVGISGANPTMRPRVVNNSWGGAGGRPIYQQMIEVWRAAGIFPAFSAGNCGDTSSNCAVVGNGSLSSPADYDSTFATGATQRNDTIAPFSSRGPSRLTSKPKPDLVAPGREIYSAALSGSTIASNGTSMASPHTAGVVALMLNARPQLSIEQIETILRLTTQDLGASGPDTTFGYGLLDAYQAVRATMNGLWWVKVPQTHGRIQPNQSSSLPIQFDARGLSAGTYRASLIIQSNDPTHAEIVIPITLLIQTTQQQPKLLITHVTAWSFIGRWNAPDGQIAQLMWSVHGQQQWTTVQGQASSIQQETVWMVQGLLPATTYDLKLVASNGVVDDNNGSFYQIVTSTALPFGISTSRQMVYLPLIQQ